MKKYIFYVLFIGNISLLHAMRDCVPVNRTKSFIEKLSFKDQTRVCLFLSFTYTIFGLKAMSKLMELTGVSCEDDSENQCLAQHMVLAGGGIAGGLWAVAPFRKIERLKRKQGNFTLHDARSFEHIRQMGLLGLLCGLGMYCFIERLILMDVI